MKVLFLVAGLGMGGAEKVVSLLAGQWAAQGWDVTVAAFDAPGEPVAHPFDDAIALVRMNIPAGRASRMKGFVATLHRLRALRRLLARERPDVAISFLTKVNVLTLLAAVGTGIPVVISERNNPSAQSAHPLWAWAWRHLAGRAAAVVLQTDAIRAHYPPDIARRAVVIPNAVSIPPHAARTLEGKVLAAVGRLDAQKGFDLLIPLFAQVAHRHPDWRLVIFGEGPERAALESLVSELGMRERIILPGNSQPGRWVAEADVFVLSSRFEGFPNVLVEAMMAGLPCVAFSCRFGPEEIIDDGRDGFLVPELDLAGMRERLERVFSDQDLRSRIGTMAQSTAGRYAPDRITSRWTDVLHAAIDT